jgi:trk system potassium uptake protein
MNPLSRFISTETEERFFRLLDRLLFAAGILSLAILIRELGWGGNYDGRYWPWSALGGEIIVIFFICQALMRVFLIARPAHYILQHKAHYAMVGLALVTFLGSGPVMHWLRGRLSSEEINLALLALLAFSQIPLVGISLLTFAKKSSQMSFRFFNAGQIFAASFALVILAGTLLLRMPNATAAPGSLAWVDAFFISTSAVCVTGLSTVDVPTTFTTLGKIILMLLIQIGGLGIMSLTYLISMLSGGGGLRSRFAMQSLLDERSLGEVGQALVQIFSFTFALEAVGACVLFYSTPWDPSMPLLERIFFSLFHSVSAFCNAGFSLYSPNLAHPGIANNLPFLGMIMILITLGGLGFPVLRNLWNHGEARLHRRVLDERSRILVHTRVVLWVSALLTLGGAAFFWIEATGPADNPALHSLFLSVSSRTAGFNTFDLATLNFYSVAFLILLMFIGASPGGTGGGVRTTSVFILLQDVWRVIRGHESQILFQRKISRQIRDRALATVILSIAILGITTGILRWLQPEIPPLSLLFECVSAFGTVGLSLNLTPQLEPASKCVIMFLMFTGRIGILLIITSLVPRAPLTHIDYPRGILNI